MREASLFIGVLLVFISCDKNRTDDTVNVSRVNMHVDTLVTIQNDRSYVIGNPIGVRTNTANEIIVLDKGLGKLLVFDDTGGFKRSISKRGPGPAELRDVMGMGIDSEDNLIVFDRSAQSFKKFSPLGELIDTYIPDKAITSPVVFFMNHNKENVLLHINFFNQPATLLNIYSDDFTTIHSSAIPVTDMVDFWYPEPLFLPKAGSFLSIGNNTALFSPYVYNGEIYKMSFDEVSKTYRITGVLKGLTYKENVTFVYKKNNPRKVDAKIETSNGAFKNIKGVITHNTSFGIFKMNNGNIFHFTYIEKNNIRTFGIEIFDSNLQMVAYSEILQKELSQDPDARNTLMRDIAWKDEEDRFYIIERENEPRIHVVRFSYD